MVLISDAAWQEIREQFSENEKVALRHAKIGDALCPRGVVIDTLRLECALQEKITHAVTSMRETAPRTHKAHG